MISFIVIACTFLALAALAGVFKLSCMAGRLLVRLAMAWDAWRADQ
jgi:hypothetical protein